MQIFGEMAIAYVRKRKPKLGIRLVLEGNDTINVVAACTSVVREAQFARRTEVDGVDLEDEPIAIRYRQYILKRKRVGNVLVACPSRLLSQLIIRQALTVDIADDTDDEGDRDDSSHASENMINGRLNCIKEYIPGVHVVAVCILPVDPNAMDTTVETFNNIDEGRTAIASRLEG